MPLIFLSCFIVPISALSTLKSTLKRILSILKSSKECGQPYFIIDFNEVALMFFTFRDMLGVSFSCIGFIMLEYVPINPTLSRTLTMKLCLFVRDFLYMCLDDHVIFVFTITYIIYYMY